MKSYFLSDIYIKVVTTTRKEKQRLDTDCLTNCLFVVMV